MNGEQEPRPTPQQVERTGLAVVHEGERIVPEEGAAAVLSRVEGAVVNYYFPVEIEIIGVGTAEELAEQIYAALQRELSAFG